MEVKAVTAKDWLEISQTAHLTVFGRHKPASLERIDFALVAEEMGKPRAYVTCKELDAESLYWQFGGAFPGFQGKHRAHEALDEFLKWCKRHYRRVSCLVENDNRPMLKLAFDAHFDIVGVRNFKGHVLLEHLLEFEEI